MNQITESIVTILTAVIGVAILAVLVSRKSATTSVLQAGGNAFSQILGVAVSPVTGAVSTPTAALGSFGGTGLMLQ